MPENSSKVRWPWRKELLIATWALCLLMLILRLGFHRKAEMPVNSDGPYITLSELGFDGERTGILGGKPVEEVCRDWSPLCDILQTEETVICGSGWASLDQDIYDVRPAALAEPLARSLIYKSYFVNDPVEYEGIDIPGYDSVRIAQVECYAVSGGRVVHIYLFLPSSYTPDEICFNERSEIFSKVLTMIDGRE